MSPYLALPGTMKLVENKIQYLNNCAKKTLSSPVCFVRNAPLLTSTGVVDVWYLWIVYCSNQFTSIGWLVGWLHYIKVHFFLHLFFFTVILLPLCMSKPKLCWLKHFRSLNLLGMFLLQNRLIWLRFLFSVGCIWATKIPTYSFHLGLKVIHMTDPAGAGILMLT